MSGKEEELRGFLPTGAESLAIQAAEGEPGEDPVDVPAPTLAIEASIAPKLSLADFQNAVPLIRELSVISSLTEDTGQLELTLSSTPAFVKPKTWHLDRVRAGERYRIRDVDVQLDGPLLTRLTEAENATVTISVRAAATDVDLLAETATSVELLARNQWGLYAVLSGT